MTMFRVPIFSWNMLVTAILILIAFPVLFGAVVMLFCDRHFGTHIFTVQGGGVPVLWQNLFWFFGHPEVYILALPYFGMVTDIIPVFSRKPLFGYKGMVFATMSIAALSTGVWAHHMFTTGVVLLPFFSLLSYLIAMPTGHQVLQLDRHHVGRPAQLPDPDALLHRLPVRLPDGRGDRRAAGLAPGRLHDPRHLLRGGPLPPGADRHRRLRRVRRLLLLVPEDVRAHAAGEPGQAPLLGPVHRVLGDLHAPVRGRPRRHAPTGGRLPARPTAGRPST